MSKDYHHLSMVQRCHIYVLLKRGLSQREIAQEVGCSQSTVSREVARNRGSRGYRYKQAHEKALIRRRKTGANAKKLNAELIQLMTHLLCEYQWSPEQISGRLKQTHKLLISHETIYRYIREDRKKGGKLYKHLRRKGKKYKKIKGKVAGRGVIPNRVDIEERPEIVDEKVRCGDFEIDLIVGKRHKGNIVSIVDRVSKVTRLTLINQATAANTAQAVIQQLSPFAGDIHTITSDNGKEFANHQDIAGKLKAQFFFAKPYHSWERGLNENTNGLVRQYFPKGTDFTTITEPEVKYVEYLLNSRPRKTLNFNTPIETFYRLTKQNLNYALRC